MKFVSRRTISTVAVLGGLLLVAAGYLWPLAGRGQWSEENAQEFAEASADQIKAAHASMHTRGELTAEESANLRDTQRRFAKIKAELETARNRPVQVGFWLKITGAALAAIGLVALIAGNDSH